MSTSLVIADGSVPAPGVVRNLGFGDSITVRRSIVKRPEWGALYGPVMTAWTRGASVNLVDDIEPRELSE